MSKQLLAALCLAAVMVAALPGTNAWHHHEPTYKVTKHNSKKVSGYNKNLGANVGKMANLDLNKNSAGSHQSGHITGGNYGYNTQGNHQSVTANPTNTQHTMITNNPQVYSTNTNDNKETKNIRKNSPNKHVNKTYKKKHGHYKKCWHCRG